MLRKAFLFLALLFLPTISYAQQVTGDLTAASASVCAADITTSCLTLQVPNNASSFLFSIQGTHNSTDLFEFTENNGTTWSALNVSNVVTQANAITSTTTTVTGVYAAPNHQYTHVRVRQSVFSSGTTNVIIRASASTTIVDINFGGGSASIGTVNQGNAGAQNWLVNCAVGCSAPTPGTPFTALIAASDNHTTVVSGAKTLLHLSVTNNSANIMYGRLYDATAFNGCNSATNLKWHFIIPANVSGVEGEIDWSAGLTFATGISFCVTGAIGDTDTTNAVASVATIQASYK